MSEHHDELLARCEASARALWGGETCVFLSNTYGLWYASVYRPGPNSWPDPPERGADHGPAVGVLIQYMASRDAALAALYAALATLRELQGDAP